MCIGVNCMIFRPQNRWRSFLAVPCLVAVALLYAPLGGAAWFVYTGACCNTGQCPIHGHHNSQTPFRPEHAMDCGHNMAAMTHCSMSCCQHPDRPALTPGIFVLPAPITVSSVTSFEPLIPAAESRNILSLLEPISPPPRDFAPAA